MIATREPSPLDRWRHRLGGRRHRHAKPRPLAALGHLVNGPVIEGLVEIDKLTMVILYDEPIRPGHCALRLAGYSSTCIPWGVRLGGPENCKFFKDLSLQPVLGARGYRLDLASTELLTLGLRLERELDRHVRHRQRQVRRQLRLPKLWAGFRPADAASITGDGPELAAYTRRTGRPPERLLEHLRRDQFGLALYPLAWVSPAQRGDPQPGEVGRIHVEGDWRGLPRRLCLRVVRHRPRRLTVFHTDDGQPAHENSRGSDAHQEGHSLGPRATQQVDGKVTVTPFYGGASHAEAHTSVEVWRCDQRGAGSQSPGRLCACPEESARRQFLGHPGPPGREHRVQPAPTVRRPRDCWQQAVALFADLERFPRRQVLRLQNLADGLVGYQGAAEFNFFDSRFRSGAKQRAANHPEPVLAAG